MIFSCEHCHQMVEVADTATDQKVLCGHCGKLCTSPGKLQVLCEHCGEMVTVKESEFGEGVLVVRVPGGAQALGEVKPGKVIPVADAEQAYAAVHPGKLVDLLLEKDLIHGMLNPMRDFAVNGPAKKKEPLRLKTEELPETLRLAKEGKLAKPGKMILRRGIQKRHPRPDH